MKTGIKILILAFIGVFLSMCKYDELPPVCRIEIEVDNIDVSYTTANISLDITSTIPVNDVSMEYATDSSFMNSEQVAMEKISLKNESEKYCISLKSLKEGQIYYFRLCANASFVSEAQQFTTKGYSLAKVRMDSISGVTTSSAIVYARLLAWGTDTLPQVGFCIAQHADVTINDSCVCYQIRRTEYSFSYNEIFSGLKDNTTYYIRPFAKNYKGVSYGEEMHFTTAEILLPKVGDVEFSDITYTTAMCTSNIISDGGVSVTSCGFCYSLSPNSTKDNNHKDSYSTKSPFSVTLSGLTAGARYYVRAYATNIKGTAYGKEDSIKVMSYTEPVVVTDENVQDITYTSALCGGSVKNNGGKEVTECGIFYSLSKSPASFNQKQKGELKDDGTFTCNLTDLSAGTKYYFCAYAINEVGIDYGEEYYFTTTLPSLPKITTADVTDITYTTAVCGGNVTDDGGQTIIERGICYSTSQNPTISNDKVSEGVGTGSFTCNLTDLTAGTTYYIRAYATNNKGTAYGYQITLQTNAATAPTVSTGRNFTCSSTTTMVCTGSVFSENGAPITECGICWSKSSNPTISNTHSIATSAGVGDFEATLIDLNMGTTYHIRAYAKNSAGISYGDDVEIKMPSTPTFRTYAYRSIDSRNGGKKYSISADFKVSVDEGIVINSAGYYASWGPTGLSDTAKIATYSDDGYKNLNVECSFRSDIGECVGRYDYTTLNSFYEYEYVRPYIVTNLGTFWGDVTYATLD